VILVTLGTHPQPMDRLVQAMDRLVARGEIREPVIIQSAAFGVPALHVRTVGVVPYEQLSAWVRDARVVITHAGPGSITLALAQGKAPIVVPRDPRAGEHVDDHQLRFAAWLQERRGIRVVTDMHALRDALDTTVAPSQQELAADRPGARAVERIRELIERQS
jgi:UDP-N-acetylglucosamine transferase subunit ALG13